MQMHKGTRWVALAFGLGAAVLVGCGSVSVTDADGAAGGAEAAAGAAGVSGSGGAAGAADASGGGRAGTAGAAGAGGAGASWPSCGSVGYSAVQVRGSCPDSSCKVCEGVKAGAAGPSATPRCVDTSEAGAVFCVVDCLAGCP
jgi:pilus assembly protein FimV